MSEHESTDEPAGEQEDEHWIKHTETVPIKAKAERSDGFGHLVNITKSALQTGLTIDEIIVEADVEFMNDKYDPEDGMLPAAVYTGDSIGGLRGRENWRTFQSAGKTKDGTPSSFQIRLPDSTLETLGYTDENCDGELIEVYAADQLLVFRRPQQGTFEIEIPEDIADYVDLGGEKGKNTVEA